MLHAVLPTTSTEKAETPGMAPPVPGERVVLWRLHGAHDDLECAVITTSYGYALSLELAGEPILLELQRTVAHLTEKADRLESWLLTQGWQVRDLAS